jgi:hypothetical protein
VLVTPRRRSFFSVAAIISLIAGQAVFAQPPAGQPPAGQTPPGQAPAAGGKTWQTGEYEVYEPITKETQPAKRLELLDAWKQKFPKSDYDDIRRQGYLQSYSQILTGAYSTQDPTQLALATKVASDVLANIDSLFGSKPPNVSDADWANAKKSVQMLAQNIPGFIAWQQKDLPKAEAEFTKSLQQEPNQPQVSLWMWTIVAGQGKKEKYSLALYEYARAVSYDGPGALDAATKQKAKADFESIYTKYHGSNEGLDALENQAKSAALPPDGFKVPSKAEIARGAAEKQVQQEEEFRKNNPMMALWQSIKTALAGPDGATYFASSMKGAALPGGAGGVKEFKGKLIEARPAVRPKELVLAIEDGKTPDAILKFDVPLAGKMEPGADIGFQGVATDYTVTPFTVTFTVEKAKLTGWKGAPAAPARPVHRARAK